MYLYIKPVFVGWMSCIEQENMFHNVEATENKQNKAAKRKWNKFEVVDTQWKNYENRRKRIKRNENKEK